MALPSPASPRLSITFGHHAPGPNISPSHVTSAYLRTLDATSPSPTAPSVRSRSSDSHMRQSVACVATRLLRPAVALQAQPRMVRRPAATRRRLWAARCSPPPRRQQEAAPFHLTPHLLRLGAALTVTLLVTSWHLTARQRLQAAHRPLRVPRRLQAWEAAPSHLARGPSP